MTGQNSGDVAQPLIEYKGVTVVRSHRRVLNNINLSVALGEHLAILGPNGAGKSSLIKTITKELYPLANGPNSYLKILGEESWNIFELRDKLGIVGSELIKSDFFSSTCLEVVLSGLFSSSAIWPDQTVTEDMQKLAKAAMRLMGISRLRDVSVDEISTGESRLTNIARALINDPLTLLLDEPTSNLDPQATRKVRQAMRRLAAAGKSIIMITHNVSDIIPEIRRVVFIRNGRIISDGEKDQIITSNSLSALFRFPLEVVKRDGYFYYW